MSEEPSDPAGTAALGTETALPATDAEVTQKGHYNRIAAEYEAHYDDPSARHYRNRFIERPLLDGLDRSGARCSRPCVAAG
jgi:hypothetical protein